jgi:hypothetical protein
MQYVNVKATFGKAHPVVARFSISKQQLTVWELSAADPPNNLHLNDPVVGKALDVGIMGLYWQVSVQVISCSNVPQFPLLFQAGYIGQDRVIHNFTPQGLDQGSLIYALFSQAVTA